MNWFRAMSSRKVLLAAVPPLASIFGSGFLIIVPVLERTLGALSVVGIAGVCGFAWLVGMTIRHNVARAEVLREEEELGPLTEKAEDAADLVIALAYVISVALYLRIMAQYVVEFAGSSSELAERGLASGTVLLIAGIGIARGFSGLDKMERLALGAVVAMTTVLGGVLFVTDAGELLGGGVSLPPVPSKSLTNVLLVLGGIVITVQGFETVRYLREEYDRETRIWACRLSQIVSSAVYIGFVAVATPLMGLGTGEGADSTLLDLTDRVLPILSVGVVVTAILSQFSAATADTVAAGGNMHGLFSKRLRGPRPYAVSGAAALVLIWALPTFTLIVVASRAFAAYYALQCVVALKTSDGWLPKVGFAILGFTLLGITLLAQPAS